MGNYPTGRAFGSMVIHGQRSGAYLRKVSARLPGQGKVILVQGETMVKGARFWNTVDAYYSQENNPTEAYNKKRQQNRTAYWMETCGPTSAVNCISAMGFKVTIDCPGDYEPQPEEVLMDFMNDPRNDTAFKKIRDMGKDRYIPENQVPQYYPMSVRMVFNVLASFKWGASFEVIRDDVIRGHAIQVCMKNPGHYIAIVAYDSDKDELIYHDSWSSKYSDGGRSHRLCHSDVVNNLQPYRIVYGI